MPFLPQHHHGNPSLHWHPCVAVEGKGENGGRDAQSAQQWGGGVEGNQAHSSIAKHLSQCLDTSCRVAEETPNFSRGKGSIEVSREMGVMEKKGGERKGRMFLVNVRC